MAGNPLHGHTVQLCGGRILLGRLLDIDSELVFSEAGRDVRMGLWVHVRVDPNGDRRLRTQCPGHIVELKEFLRGLHIKHQDLRFQRIGHVLGLFANAGEDDLPRIYLCLECPVQFATGDNVHASPFAGEEPQDGQVGIGLHGKAREMGDAVKGIVKGPEMLPQGSIGVEIQGCPDGLGNVRHRHILAMQIVANVVKMMHGATSRFLVTDVGVFRKTKEKKPTGKPCATAPWGAFVSSLRSIWPHWTAAPAPHPQPSAAPGKNGCPALPYL